MPFMWVAIFVNDFGIKDISNFPHLHYNGTKDCPQDGTDISFRYLFQHKT